MRRAVWSWIWLVVAAPAAAGAELWIVAPFLNQTKDRSLDWIGESVAETLRESMAASGLSVVSRDSRVSAARTLSLTGPQITLAAASKLAEATGADRLAYGRFELVTSPAPVLRVTARLMDVRQTLLIGQVSETGSLESLTVIQTDLAWNVLRQLRPSQYKSREEFRARHRPVKLSALESYVRGLIATQPEVRHRLFTQAARLDPSFAHPAFYLGRTHFQNDSFREAADWLGRVGPDHPDFLEAHFLLGISRFELGDFAGALRAFEQVAAAEPSSEVWNNLAAAQSRLDRPEALANFLKALNEKPEDPDYLFNVGYALWQRGEFATAADRFRGVLDRNGQDDDALLLLGRCLKQSGPRPGDPRTEGLERLKDTRETR